METTTPQLSDIGSCLDLARRQASPFRQWASARGMDWEDLVGEANIALVHASERFKPELGTKFAAYAARVIRNALCKAIRQHKRFLSMTGADGEMMLQMEARSQPDQDLGMDVQALLQKLPHLEKEVLQERYGLMDGEEWETRRIAAVHRIKEERVRIVLHRALTILRCQVGLFARTELSRCMRENSSCRVLSMENKT